jgi:hypothetical protein
MQVYANAPQEQPLTVFTFFRQIYKLVKLKEPRFDACFENLYFDALYANQQGHKA